MKVHPIQAYREARDMPLREAARLIGVSTVTVWQWENGARRIPAERAIEIERITGISRGQLRPDLWSGTNAVTSD